MENGIEHALFLRALLKELLVVDHEFPIFAWTDSNNTFKAVHSTSPVDDRKLRLDIACLQENVAKENVKINWCKGDKMLANCLTKKAHQLIYYCRQSLQAILLDLLNLLI